MPGPTLLLTDTFRAADPLKWQAVFTGQAQHNYGVDGLMSYGAGVYPNHGLISLGTFTRANLLLVFCMAGKSGLIGNFFGYANDLPGTQRAISSGTFVSLNGGMVYSYSYSGGVQVEAVNGGSVFTGSAPVDRWWVAMKLLATGAQIKWRKGDTGGWTPATANPATVSASNLKVVMSAPYSADMGVVWGGAVEQSDGDFSDARLDAIIAAANLRPGYLAAPARTTAATRQFQAGKTNTLTVELMDGDRAVTGLTHASAVCTLVKNGVASAKTLDASNFTEVDAASAPGLYRLTLAKTDVSALGELLVILSPPAGSWRFAPCRCRGEVTAIEAMMLFGKTALSNGVVQVKDADGATLFSTQYKRVDGLNLSLAGTHFGGHEGWVQA